MFRVKYVDCMDVTALQRVLYLARLLAPMERREGEEGGQLSQRVQESLREELKLQESQVTLDNVTAWLKGRLRDSHTTSNIFFFECGVDLIFAWFSLSEETYSWSVSYSSSSGCHHHHHHQSDSSHASSVVVQRANGSGQNGGSGVSCAATGPPHHHQERPL